MAGQRQGQPRPALERAELQAPDGVGDRRADDGPAAPARAPQQILLTGLGEGVLVGREVLRVPRNVEQPRRALRYDGRVGEYAVAREEHVLPARAEQGVAGPPEGVGGPHHEVDDRVPAAGEDVVEEVPVVSVPAGVRHVGVVGRPGGAARHRDVPAVPGEQARQVGAHRAGASEE